MQTKKTKKKKKFIEIFHHMNQLKFDWFIVWSKNSV